MTIEKNLSECMPQISNEAYRFECADAEELEEISEEKSSEHPQMYSDLHKKYF